MKKAFDQTVRDLKREVNKKVLKVPGIEQKILDATSNEPWGPHGSHLADIAQATRNYHEYQMIMHVIWKRLNDIGKNWRHVYKGLTVLEYLVGHGSERVIDEIREHAYQIQTLADFQYIDSSGRDQGSNVRRKSQSLVALVNDKEKVQEVRQKALANRDKFRSTFSTGGRYGDRYDDDRSEGRYRDSYDGRYKDDDRNGYGKERDWGSRDDERYGRGRDAYYRDGDHSGRDSDERYGQDRYRNDDYRGGRGNDDYQSGQRSRSSDRDGDRSYEDDDRYYSSRNGGRADDPSQDERRLERKLSEQSPPPSYEETVGDSNNNLQDESSKGNGNVAISAANAYSPPVAKAVCSQSTPQGPNQSMSSASPSASNKEPDEFDEFDPRSAVPAPECGSGVDLFATQSALDPINALALVPVDFNPASEADAPSLPAAATNFVPLSSASSALSQPSEDPFGDGQFKATPQGNFQARNQGFAPAPSFQPSSAPPAAPRLEPTPTFDFGDSLGGLTYTPTVVNGHQHFAPPPSSMPAEFPMTQASNNMYTAPPAYTSQQFVVPPVYTSQQFTAPSNTYTNTPTPNVNYPPQSVPNQQTTNSVNLLSQPGLSSAHTATTQTALTLYEQPAKAQQPTDKFETKSTVWADTLNRGLVNLNISGAKTNPLADIGVDFEAINRMDKRKQKSSAAPATSTVTMGKAMGSGSGIVRAGASGVATTSNSVMGPGVGMGMGTGMGMGIGPGPSMGMGGYGGGMNQPMGMGMGMNMGMNPGAPMRPPPIQGQGMYSPMMGMGGYGSQQPYGGGGYR